MRSMSVLWRGIVLVLVLVGGEPLRAEVRVWTSQVGTTLEAEYLATVNGRLWLKESEGRLIKVEPAQLIAADREFVDTEPVVRTVLRARDVDTETEAVLEGLASVEIPSYHVNGIGLQEAMNRLSALVSDAAPERPRVMFDVGELGERVRVSLLLRKRPALTILAFICRAYDLEVRGRGGDGRLLVRPQVLGEDMAGTASTTAPRMEDATVPTGGKLTSTTSDTAVVAQDREPASACSVPLAMELYMPEPGFEQASRHWVMVNRKTSFRRIESKAFQSWEGGGSLGGMVMMVKPTPYDGNRADGPPYMTREIEVPLGVRRLRVCCDLAYDGSPAEGSKVRLSITNPEVKYVEGGRSFPYLWIRPESPRRWRHVEWEVDVADMGGRRLDVGVMLPFSKEAWYVDNVKVSIAGH